MCVYWQNAKQIRIHTTAMANLIGTRQAIAHRLCIRRRFNDVKNATISLRTFFSLVRRSK